MSSIIQQDINIEAKRVLILAEIAEKKRLEEEKRIQHDINIEAQRKIILAEIAEKMILDTNARIRKDIERQIISNNIKIKQEEKNKKEIEIEIYKQENIRVQNDIYKINNEIVSLEASLELSLQIKLVDVKIEQ